ncbi:MAG: type II secretion system protein [Puniceicoccales bacterium]
MRRYAFTLVELLCVIAVIALMAGILISVASKVRREVNRSKSINNMRSIASAMLVYSGDHDGRLPMQGNNPPTGTGEPENTGTTPDYWATALNPYLDSSDPNLRTSKHPIYEDPFCEESAGHPISDYGVNTRIVRSPSDGGALPVASIQDPARKILLVPAESMSSDRATWYLRRDYDTQDGDDAAGGGNNRPSQRGNPGYILCVFVDGHTAMLPVESLNSSEDKQKYFRPEL